MFPFVTLLPLLHTGGPQPTGPLYTHWVLDPMIAAYVFGITALYLAWVGPLNRRRPGSESRPVEAGEIRWFLLGSLAALVALGPPIDDWSDWFFVSVHMFQHLLLIFAVVPCWLAGIPAWVYRPLFRDRWTSLAFRGLTKPVTAYLISSVIVIGWHIPVLYNWALTNNMVHAFEHQFFILAGFLIWWPLMSKVPEAPRLSTPVNCLYIFLLTLPSGIVGAFITYAGPGLYSAYDKATVRPFGLGIKTDQEIAGLMMWVGMNAILLILLSIIFLRWGSQKEAEDRADLQARARTLHGRGVLPKPAPHIADRST